MVRAQDTRATKTEGANCRAPPDEIGKLRLVKGVYSQTRFLLLPLSPPSRPRPRFTFNRRTGLHHGGLLSSKYTFSAPWSELVLLTKMSSTGTIRNRTMGRGQLPFDGPSGIPRKVDHPNTQQSGPSDVGSSTLSASRQKQSKRDEVHLSSYLLGTICRGAWDIPWLP